jgi:glycosyltransferase involved in cell wall biosynthesis
MKIAVMTIALNEEKHVESWANSARSADLLLIADTGSTDGTREAAQDMGVETRSVLVRPWRFDVARNAALAQLPADIDVVITLDMDEVLTPGWRQKLEDTPRSDQYVYDYVWSWKEDGTPDIQFQGNRCHARFGYVWKHPIHEVLTRADGQTINGVHAGFGIHHHADDFKSRSQYLPLLELAARESPHDDRIAHYYARELYFRNDWDAARMEFVRHLSLPSAVWPAERARSLRYIAAMDNDPERWLLKAVAEDSSRREGWVELAEHYQKTGQPIPAAGAAQRALSITTRTFDYMTESKAWDDQYLKGFLEV